MAKTAISAAIDVLISKIDNFIASNQTSKLAISATQQEVRNAISNDITSLQAITSSSNDLGIVLQEGIVQQSLLVSSLAPITNSPQIIRFYDGLRFGYLEVYTDKINLVAGEQVLSYTMDTTSTHTYRVWGKGDDVKVYVDGQLVIDGTGVLTSPTSTRSLEFGATEATESYLWSNIKYTTLGAFAPEDNSDTINSEIISLPEGSLSCLKEYNGKLYMALNPNIPDRSSAIYRYEPGYKTEKRSVMAITKSNVMAIQIDPTRPPNIFGSTGKYLGTDRGLQYMLGSKVRSYDKETYMHQLPDSQGWQRNSNSEGVCTAVFNDVLGIDTRTEDIGRTVKYTQEASLDSWVTKADNKTGWTVDTEVRVAEDGSVSPDVTVTGSDYVFVLARGSSMALEDNLPNARRLLSEFLLQLTKADRFSVVLYNTGADCLSSNLLEATGHNIAAAIDFINATYAVGDEKIVPAVTVALRYDWQASNKKIVLISEGQTTETPTGVAAAITAINTVSAKIYTIGVGSVVLTETPAKKTMLQDIATSNGGISAFAENASQIDTLGLSMWRSIGGTSAFPYDATTPSIGTGTHSSTQDKNSSGLLPEEDGTSTPGVLINDGTYQEIVQFYRTGIRLKYANLFSPIDLSSAFNSIRIIGKGTAVGVYARRQGESAYRRIIFAPEALYVKSALAGNQEIPAIAVDSMGMTHAAWQEAENGRWGIYYSKMAPPAQAILATGSALGPTNAQTAPLIGVELAANLDNGVIPVYTPNINLVAAGVKAGDRIILYNTEASGVFDIISIASENIVLLDGTNWKFELDVAMECCLFRGDTVWLPPVLISAPNTEAENPSIISHSSGDIIVAFDAANSGNKEIFLRRISYTPFQITTRETIRVTNAVYNSVKPCVKEIADKAITVVWQDSRNYRLGSQIMATIVQYEDFLTSTAATYQATNLTTHSTACKNAKVSVRENKIYVAYEDNEQIKLLVLDPTTNVAFSFGLLGAGTNPTIETTNTNIVVAWQVLGLADGISNIAAVVGTFSATSVTLSSAEIVTMSAQSAVRPVAVAIGSDVWVFFDDDRITPSQESIYATRYCNVSKTWQSTEFSALDVSIDMPILKSSYATAAANESEIVLAFQGENNSGRNIVASCNVAIKDLLQPNDKVVAYFPLADNIATTNVVNRITTSETIPPPLDVVLVIDCSQEAFDNGFITTHKSVASDIISALTTEDRLDVVSCSHISDYTTNSAFSYILTPMVSANKVTAANYVSALTAMTKTACTTLGTRTHADLECRGGIPSAYAHTFYQERQKLVIVLSGAYNIGTSAFSSVRSRVSDTVSYYKLGAEFLIFGDQPSTDSTTLINNIASICSGRSFLPTTGGEVTAKTEELLLAISGTRALDQKVYSIIVRNDATCSINSSSVHVAGTTDSIAGLSETGAFDFSGANAMISAPKELILESGAIEFSIKPSWAAPAAATSHTWFGSIQPGLTTPDNIVFYYDGSGNLVFEIIDSDGISHKTTAPVTWAASDVMHFRTSWDAKAMAEGSYPITSLVNIDASNIMACGQGGLILTSTDAGATWSKLISKVTYDLNSIAMVTSSKFIVVGENGTILYTQDSGTTWDSILGVTSATLNCVIVYGTDIFAVGDSGVILKASTTDLTLWTEVTSPTVLSLKSVAVIGTTPTLVVAGEEGKAYITTNLSTPSFTAATVTLPSGVSAFKANSICASSSDSAIIACDKGLVLSTTDAGATWSGEVITTSDLLCAYTDGSSYYVCGKNAFLAVYVSSWTTISTTIQNGSLVYVTSYSGILYVAGPGGSVLTSPDGGITQIYYVASIANLTIYQNGIEIPQTRSGEGSFNFTLSSDLILGDYSYPTSAMPANAVFSQVVIYKTALPGGSVTGPRNLARVPVSITPIFMDGMNKRIEFGNISDVKASSYWKSFKYTTEGSIEPLRIFGWNTQLGLVDDVIRDITIDKNGRVWLATENGIGTIDGTQTNDEIDRFTSGAAQFVNQLGRIANITSGSSSLPTDKFNCIKALGDDLWIGSNFGLFLLSVDNATARFLTQPSVTDPNFSFTTFDSSVGMPSSKIQCLLPTTDAVYVGTDQGLVVMKRSGTTWEQVTYGVSNGLPSANVLAITKDSNDIWVGTDRGVAKFAAGGSSDYGYSFGLANEEVFSLATDKAGIKYIGTGYGMAVMEGSEISNILPSQGLGVGAIQAIGIDANDKKWLATSVGLVEFDNSGSQNLFTRYTIEDGLLGDPNIVDFKNYYILGSSLASGGCEKLLVRVNINGEPLDSSLYEVVPHVPMLTFANVLKPSDKVEVLIDYGWRKVYDFTGNPNSNDSNASVRTTSAEYLLYKRRFPAGTAIFGANKAIGSDAPSAKMYTVFILPARAMTVTATTDIVSGVSLPETATIAFAKDQTTGTYASIYSDDTTAGIISNPAILDSSVCIQMPSADVQNITDNYLNISLQTDVDIYIAYDATAYALPNWLRVFDPVKSVFRINQIKTFTDASNQEKLFVAGGGTQGALYDVLDDFTICDISKTVVVDANGPTGCASITNASAKGVDLTFNDVVDEISGVASMQLAYKSDFKDNSGNDMPWLAYAPTASFEIPSAQNLLDTTVDNLDTQLGITADFFYLLDTKTLIASRSSGSVYYLDNTLKTISKLLDTGLDQVTCFVQFNDNLYIGGNVSTFGRVLKCPLTSLSTDALSTVWENPVALISSMTVFDSKIIIGTSPDGRIYSLDSTGNAVVFKATSETNIEGFAVAYNQLWWASTNNKVDEGDTLYTNTRLNHRHSIIVQAGITRLSQVTGQTITDPSIDHVHTITNGIVETTEGHTHSLMGSYTGRVFKYDLVTRQASVAHVDKDYSIKSIVSSSISSPTGLLFAGTKPNGKILRYVPTDAVFLKSFDTLSDEISVLRILDNILYAVADKNLFTYDGTRWQFLLATQETIKDITSIAGDLYLLQTTKISKSKIGGASTSTQPQSITMSAYVRFRDNAGNVTTITDSSGNIQGCYNPTTSITVGGTGTGTTSELAHRIVEIDETANSVFQMNTKESLFSGTKIEQEVAVYESEIINGTPSLVQWTSIQWDGFVPVNTSIGVAVRSASTQAGIANAEWSSDITVPTATSIASQMGQYLQFKATLRSTDTETRLSPELYSILIKMRTSEAAHYFTTNFNLPTALLKGILTYNGCVNPPMTDIVFGINAKNSTDFTEYLVITPNKVFDVPQEYQGNNVRVGIKLISNPDSVPVVDEFALLVALANDAIIRFNLPGTPSSEGEPIDPTAPTRTVVTDVVQGHSHTITFASTITEKSSITGNTSVNGSHSHQVVNGVIQTASGHSHEFSI